MLILARLKFTTFPRSSSMDCSRLKNSEQSFFGCSCWAFVPLQSGGECSELPHRLPALSCERYLLSAPLPQSQPVLLQNEHCVHNKICPFVRDFPLQILIRPPPNARLFRLGLRLNNHQNAECARRIFSSVSEWITTSPPRWLGKLRGEVRLLQSYLCFTKPLIYSRV